MKVFWPLGLKFIDRRPQGRKAIFRLDASTTRMHIWTTAEERGPGKRTGIGLYTRTVWWNTMTTSVLLLKKLDDLGIADNTIVVYSTDNGAETVSWPDGGITPVPWRERHDLGGWLPRTTGYSLAGRHQAGHNLQRHHLPRGLAADIPGMPPASPDVVEKLKNGLQGQRQGPGRSTWTATTSCPYFKGEVDKGPS